MAAGTCICGRNLAPLVNSVVCLDATPAMLKIGRDIAEKERLTNIQFVQGYAEAIHYPSHVRNASRSEFLALFQRYGCKLVKAEGTGIPVELSAWMELTKTPGQYGLTSAGF